MTAHLLRLSTRCAVLSAAVAGFAGGAAAQGYSNKPIRIVTGPVGGGNAPAKTPVSVISRLYREIVAYLKTPAARERFLNSGVEAVGGTPAELASTIKSEMARMGKLIKDLGIRAE